MTQYRFASHPSVRLIGVALAISLCIWTINAAATFGLSRLFVRYAVGMGSLDAGNQAVRLTPVDPESHLANAEVLSIAGRHSESVLELERAVALRPSDYSLWFSLGMLRDQTGNPAGALAAFDEAIKRAPFYAQPRWQRGNVFLRKGQYDAAFKDLNLAAQSDPELIPNLIDLAWAVSKADPKLTEQRAQINSDKMRIAFARLLARQGNATETVAQFRAAGIVPSDIKRELVEQLLAKGAFKEAYEIWNCAQSEPSPPAIFDGGFEAPLNLDQMAFGWRISRTLPAVTLAVDSSKPHSGSKSLKLEFTGDSTTEPPYVSQLILLGFSGRHRINFAWRSEDVVSGGLPVIVVRDAASERKELGRSATLFTGTRDWQVTAFEFNVPSGTTALLLGFQRDACATSPCPAFGSIWLDSFSIEPLR